MTRSRARDIIFLMKANLHIHSRYSDGTDWPEDIVRRAVIAGLEHISLTDHDSLGGVKELCSVCTTYGITCTAAVEIDCMASEIGYKSELLAYFPHAGYDNTNAFLQKVLQQRRTFISDTLIRAGRHFVRPEINFDLLCKRKCALRNNIPVENISFSKIDIYLLLKDMNLIPPDVSYKLFKKTYLDSRLLCGPAYPKAHCKQVVETVHADGGFVVLPHPGHEFNDDASFIKKNYERFVALLDYFVSIGLDGIELYYYKHKKAGDINKLVKKEAKKRGLFVTYGSDCHGPGSGKESLGLFHGNFKGFPVR